jgi:DNA-directed RNA polymerase subunit RPC12/RpoP
MFGDYSKDLLRSGIIELKAGNREAARRYIDRAIYMSGDREVMAEAWYWMSQATDEARGQREALENCLANDLQHARARRALALLDGKLKPDDIIDPEAVIPAPSLEGAEARRFTCAKCGGRMAYAPDGKSLLCEYCRRHEAVATERPPAGTQDFIVAMATRRGHSQPLREQVRRCQACGAEFILPPAMLSFSCAYCGSAQVVDVPPSGELMAPDGIAPHMFDQRNAADVLADWIESLRIETDEPAALPRGLYLPIWTFTLGGGIDYSGEKTADEGAAYGDRLPRQVKVSGRHPILMSASVAASRRPSAPFVRLIAGFDMSAVRPYDARYLAAWPAELYDVSMAQASLEARSQAYAALKRDLPTLVAPVQLTSTSSANLTVESFRLDLLPVWMTEILVEGRRGLVLINGQNGSVFGDTFKRAGAKRQGMTIWLRDLLND